MTNTRRQVLSAAGFGAGALALAACGSASPTTAPTSSSTTAAAAGGGDDTPNPGVLAKLADVPVGGAVSASDANGKPMLICQPTAGAAVAFSAICPHQGCTVAPAGKELGCPCHGSRFDLATGAVLNGPATSPLTKIDVTVQDGNVVPGS